MEEELYQKVNGFLKKYPLTIAVRIRQHVKILVKHLNSDEEVIYVFTAQKNSGATEIFSTCVVALTSKRILIVQKRVLPGYRINSITPDLFNDFQVSRGIFFGKIAIDTVKEIVHLSNLDPKCLPEVETELSEYLLKEKPKILKQFDETSE